MASGEELLAWFGIQGAGDAGAGHADFYDRNQHFAAHFSHSTGDAVIYEGVMPNNYDGGSLVCFFLYGNEDGGDANNIVWSIEFERIQAGTTDIDTASFATTQLSVASGNATAGLLLEHSFTIGAGSQTDNIAAGDAIRVKVGREGSDAGDTNLNDMFLVRFWIEEA